MIIRFTKGNSKQDTLTCVRDDGSCTWSPLQEAEHDFGHYAIETTLGWSDAFFGLLMQGWDIADFGCINLSTGCKPTVPVQALQAEAAAGLLDIERRSGVLLCDAVFNAMLGSSCDGLDLPRPDLSPAQISSIRICQDALLRCWQQVPQGQTLDVVFERYLKDI